MRLDGRVVLVVGASSGIGRAFCVQAAAAGALLAVTARRGDLLQELADEVGTPCLVMPCDALDEVASAAAVQAVVEHYGCIDVALLNVGGAPAIDLRTQSAADVKHWMRVNYDVAVNTLMPVLAQMSEQGEGLVAVTNSLAGLAPIPTQGPYSAAKGALRLLVDTCRLEYASRGIRFVSIYPGFVDTERIAADGVTKSRLVSAEQAAAEVLTAIVRENHDHLFPLLTALQLRAAQLLPARVRDLLLARRVLPDPGAK